MTPYQMISASIIGKSHRRLFYNNQDAYKVYQEETFSIAVVCDGCGSSPNSEVGARLTAEFVVNYCEKNFRSLKFNGPQLAAAVCNFYMDCAVRLFAKDPFLFIKETFYTTVVGCILSENQNVIFSAGDGIVVVDSDIQCIEQNNSPQYLAHNITSNQKYGFTERKLTKGSFSRILIATDGLEDLWEKVDRDTVIEELFSRKNFENEIELSKYISPQENLFDDTTVVMIKVGNRS